jgi:hypothetical protein
MQFLYEWWVSNYQTAAERWGPHILDFVCVPLEQLPVLLLSNILRQGPRKPGEQPITMYRQLGQLSLGFLTTYAPSPGLETSPQPILSQDVWHS